MKLLEMNDNYIRFVMITTLHSRLRGIDISLLSKKLILEYLFLIDLSNKICKIRGSYFIKKMTEYQKRTDDFFYEINKELEDLLECKICNILQKIQKIDSPKSPQPVLE